MEVRKNIYCIIGEKNLNNQEDFRPWIPKLCSKP